ncbi:hypothetical protein CB0940_06068 [Cercospora beticola]|uniref:Uncharacterized protein n=1 Tax=Cercospora beticola TaxID=122368 RepID=A0A2G5HXM2_CERBT|nr:hypothetical protein CB0940_06068 [Cercospora beticola]PIA97288.1 hypothetical protein CB0940_06068 [Cercospora beticola]WPA98682.1 hypothetical protein RHO25_003295 [Cercospora beticola]CAK1359949.1 unnamed protein product [Cercospora beticola]
MARQMRPLSRRLQFIQARATQRLPDRTFTTTPPHLQEDSNEPSTSLESLKEIDTIALSTTKSHITHILSTTQSLQHLTSQILPQARSIQLNPQIPPYTPSLWTLQHQTAPPRLALLHEHATRLHQNLTDLQTTPHAIESNTTSLQKFKSDLNSQTKEDKWNEYINLKYLEKASLHRQQTRIDTLQAEVDTMREENLGLAARRAAKAGAKGKKDIAPVKAFKPAFRRALAGSVMERDDGGGGGMKRRKQSLAETVKSNRERGRRGPQQGWGATATEKAEVGAMATSGARKPSPFQNQKVLRPATANAKEVDGIEGKTNENDSKAPKQIDDLRASLEANLKP